MFARCISAGSGPVNLLVSLEVSVSGRRATGAGIVTRVVAGGCPALLVVGGSGEEDSSTRFRGCCDVELGRESVPLEPLVHVLARCGRFRRVPGSVGRPMLNRGVFGLSESSSPSLCIPLPGRLREEREGLVPGKRLDRGREPSSISGCVDGPARACCSISSPCEERPRLRKSMASKLNCMPDALPLRVGR